MDRLIIEQLKNSLAADLNDPSVLGFKRPISYSRFNGSGPEFDSLVYQIVQEWKTGGGGDAEAGQLLALLRPTDSLASVVQGAIGFLELLASRQANNVAAPDGLDDKNVAVLFCLSNRAPALQTLDDIIVAAKVSRDTASKALRELIGAGLACRPKGERKGATVTDRGRSTAALISR